MELGSIALCVQTSVRQATTKALAVCQMVGLTVTKRYWTSRIHGILKQLDRKEGVPVCTGVPKEGSCVAPCKRFAVESGFPKMIWAQKVFVQKLRCLAHK